MNAMNETEIFHKESSLLREGYDRILHKSGLSIYVFPKKMSTAYALFGTRYGAIDNCFRPEGEDVFRHVPDGIAHFLEHKMFEAEDGSDTNERFARLGASANAFTSADMTAYEFSCTENFYEALTVLLDYVTHPYFTVENVKKEQGIIGQEICGCDDNPHRRLYYDLLDLLYEKSNIRIPICGTKESIAVITPELLYRCYQAFYQLSNMALVICGDVDTKEVLRVADQILERQDPKKIERYFEADKELPRKKRGEDRMPVGLPLFAIGFKDLTEFETPREEMRRALIMRILTELLFGTSTDFYGRMYEEGFLDRNFSGGYESARDASFYLLFGESTDPETVWCRLFAMLEERRKDLPSRKDFLRVRRAIYAEHIRAFDSTEAIADEFLADLFAGVDLLEVNEILSAITYEEAMDVLMNFFTEEMAAMAVIRPIDENKGE